MAERLVFVMEMSVNLSLRQIPFSSFFSLWNPTVLVYPGQAPAPNATVSS